MTIAYCVARATVVGAEKFAEYQACVPLQSVIESVVDARSEPVGKPPDVARTLTIMVGGAAEQKTQNRFRSILVSDPDVPAVNVCAAQCPTFTVPLASLPILSPFAVMDVFCWSIADPPPPVFDRSTLPGLDVVSTLVRPVPVWKSDWLVSVMQLAAAPPVRADSNRVKAKSTGFIWHFQNKSCLRLSQNS